MPDFANDAHYQGLRYKYIHLRWESDRQDSKPKRPRALGIVPCFHTEHSLIVDNSLTFGTPIIGDNKSFKRAILLQPMKPVGRWQYILAQTERQNKPIYIRVPTGKAVPYWPHMHSPHLLLLAEIAPFITGLSSPGLDNIQKAADDCYRPSISVDVSPSERAISLADENPPSSASSQSWPGYPVLAEIRQLGDWMLKHAAPEDATPPGPLTTTVPLPVHWYEPKSEPPADDFQLLSRYPSQSLRYRGHIPRRELFLFPQPPPPTFTEPPSAHLCPSYHTSTHPEQHSSSKGTHSPPKFTSASPDTFTTLRSSKSMLSLRPITERIRRLSTGGKKERNRRVEQTPCLPISYSTQ
ncbi:hypothetical protein V5O48_001859 [Marasmius crinis-equi]|uniref:Uncharacterized protein n=1 Tax=Marasmius crinis-equi TaxID=585013 RepID=A0ABR3FX89_9AGAR